MGWSVSCAERVWSNSITVSREKDLGQGLGRGRSQERSQEKGPSASPQSPLEGISPCARNERMASFRVPSFLKKCDLNGPEILARWSGAEDSRSQGRPPYLGVANSGLRRNSYGKQAQIGT